MVKQPGLFLPKFRATSSHVFMQLPQNITLEPAIHSLACWDRCFMLPQLLCRWQHQSGIFWIPPRIPQFCKWSLLFWYSGEKFYTHLWFPPRNSKWVKKQSSRMSLPWATSGFRKSILSRTLFAMVSTSNSLLTARWVMRSVGEKFTFCLLKIGGSSSSLMCMNPVVLCKTHIYENTHKTYIKNI
jgi:hypothetical protein